MGLHPKAIMSVLLEILELVQMGKKSSYLLTLPSLSSLCGLSTS